MFHRQLSLSLCDIHSDHFAPVVSPWCSSQYDRCKGLGLRTTSTIINHRSQGTTFAVKSQGMSFSVLVWMPSSSRVVRHFRTGTWWFGTFFYDFPYIGNHHPDWRTHIFQRGRYATNQDIYGIFLTFLNPYFTGRSGRRSQKKHDIILGA